MLTQVVIGITFRSLFENSVNNVNEYDILNIRAIEWIFWVSFLENFPLIIDVEVTELLKYQIFIVSLITNTQMFKFSKVIGPALLENKDLLPCGHHFLDDCFPGLEINKLVMINKGIAKKLHWLIGLKHLVAKNQSRDFVIHVFPVSLQVAVL